MIKNGSRTYVRATSPPLGGRGSVVVFISDTNEASPYVFPPLSLSRFICLCLVFGVHMTPTWSLCSWSGLAQAYIEEHKRPRVLHISTQT